jgi:hypothetical protein
LLRGKAASQPLDSLCVKREDKTSVKSQWSKNHKPERQLGKENSTPKLCLDSMSKRNHRSCYPEWGETHSPLTCPAWKRYVGVMCDSFVHTRPIQ